jgi:hypothetical protein
MVDYNMVFSDAQAVTSTADSTNIIDLGVADANLGEGTPLNVHIRVNTKCTASGSATVTIQILHGATSGAATTQLWESTAIAKATLVKNYELVIPLPFTHMQFLKGKYTIATGPLTAGKFDMWIEPKA